MSFWREVSLKLSIREVRINWVYEGKWAYVGKRENEGLHEGKWVYVGKFKYMKGSEYM